MKYKDINITRISLSRCLVLASCFYFFLGNINSAFANSIEKTAAEVRGDFVLSGARQEIELDSGQSTKRVIYVTNRTGEPRDFDVSVEDIKGGDESEPIQLLGDSKGPYPLKTYITPEITHFHLKQGDRMALGFTVAIPNGEEPGGRYASILVSSSGGGEVTNGTKLTSRLSALIFVRVKGEAKESGYLEGFDTLPGKNFFLGSKPSGFVIRYRNTGNVHDYLSGNIAIRNSFGAEVAKVDIPEFYSLPGAVRYRRVENDLHVPGGRYVAALELAPGFGNKNIIVSTSFWVIPYWWIAIFAGVFVAITVAVMRSRRRFNNET